MSSEYRVQARNLSHASENRIHADDVARRFGFRGGLVPGVEVYAYMTHLPVARWGVEWLERGTAECRFTTPVYDGKLATVTATQDADQLVIEVESEGVRCASGSAALRPASPAARSQWTRESPPAADERPEASEETLAIGRRLSSHAMQITHERLEQYLADIGETEPLYSREKIVHPALALRLCNSALKDNVKLAAWIHTASSVRHCTLARAGVSLAAHALVAANYERKGHRFVELDACVVADEERIVATVRHTAIFRLRQAEQEA